MTSARLRDTRAGLALVSPTVLVTVLVIVLPIVWNILLAFQDKSFMSIRTEGIFGGGLTLKNFAATFADGDFWETLGVTLVYALSVTAGTIVLGLVAALALRSVFRGRGVVRSVMLLPYVAPVVAVAFVWEMMLNPQFGIVNHVLPGEAINVLGQTPWALISVIAFEIWRYFPFAFMFISARLVALPRDVEEAALVDGATPSQNFLHVVLPQLASTLSLLALLRVIMTFNKFDDVYLLTCGSAGTEVAAVRVYNQLMSSYDISGAAATALILALVLAGFLLAYFTLARKGEDQ